MYRWVIQREAEVLCAKNVRVVLGAMESWYPSVLGDQVITGEINLLYVIHKRETNFSPYIYRNPYFVLVGGETRLHITFCLIIKALLEWSYYGADYNTLHHYQLVSLLRIIYGEHKGRKLLFFPNI